MNGFSVLLGKEWMEIWRTWRIWVLPGILLVVGLSSPVLAAITPWLLESLTTDDAGVIIQIPDPEAIHAYQQFAQMATQIVLLALIVVSGNLVSGERRSGTAVLVLTKPVSIAAFLLSRFVSQSLLVLGGLIPAAIVCWLGTLLIFGEAPFVPFLKAILLFAVLSILLIAVMLVCSTLVNSTAGAAGIGFGVYLILNILSGFGPTRDYSPAGLYSAIAGVISDTNPPVLLPSLTAILATALLILFAIRLFSRQELASRLGSG